MRKLYLVLYCMLACVMIGGAQITVVTGTVAELIPGERATVSLLPLKSMGRPLARGEIGKEKEFRLEADIKSPGFYQLGVAKQFYTVYLHPGDRLSLDCDGEKAKVAGEGWITENQLLIDNQRYQTEYFRLPIPVRTSYGQERADGAWKAYRAKLQALEQTAVRPEFAELYRGFARVEYWSAMVGGLGHRTDEKISPEYEKALERVTLTGTMVQHARWYEVLEAWLTYKMRMGDIRLSGYENWLKDLTAYIRDKELREAYLMEQVRLEVLRGEFVGLPQAVRKIEKMIRKPDNRSELKNLMDQMEKNYSQYAHCMPGTDLSDFEFTNREGKTVKLGDWKGKFVYIDIWSTGCLPCRQEIPHLEKLEQAMTGQNIEFISISLDTKKDLWLKFMQDKGMQGVQLLADGGFKHPICKTMGMRGIPRFILLDKDCRVINFSAKRPSNPILWKYLEEIVEK